MYRDSCSGADSSPCYHDRSVGLIYCTSDQGELKLRVGINGSPHIWCARCCGGVQLWDASRTGKKMENLPSSNGPDHALYTQTLALQLTFWLPRESSQEALPGRCNRPGSLRRGLEAHWPSILTRATHSLNWPVQDMDEDGAMHLSQRPIHVL